MRETHLGRMGDRLRRRDHLHSARTVSGTADPGGEDMTANHERHKPPCRRNRALGEIYDAGHYGAFALIAPSWPTVGHLFPRFLACRSEFDPLHA